MKGLDLYSWVAFILVLACGINCGLMGLFNTNIIASIVGSALGRLVFIAMGLAAGYLIYNLYTEKMKNPI